MLLGARISRFAALSLIVGPVLPPSQTRLIREANLYSVHWRGRGQVDPSTCPMIIVLAGCSWAVGGDKGNLFVYASLDGRATAFVRCWLG